MTAVSSFNFLKQSLGMDSRGGWVYAQRIFIGLSLTLVFYAVQASDSTGAQGLVFFSSFCLISLILLTCATVGIFSTAVTAEKESQQLSLILITGSTPLSYVLGRYWGKLLLVINLIFLLIPATLFGVTLGGIAMIQVINFYAYLFCWIIFVSSLCFWLSVFFSTIRESLVVASFFLGILLFISLFFEFSPFVRIYANLNLTTVSFVFPGECYFYLLISLYFIYSSCKNLEFAAAFPISFYENFQKSLKKKDNKLAKSIYHSSRLNKRGIWRQPIIDKDQLIFPYRKFFTMDNPFSIVVGTGLLMIFPVTLVLGYLYIPYALSKTWDRLLKCFGYELEENTFPSLYVLPLTGAELLNQKIKSSCFHNMGLMIYYVIFLGYSYFSTFNMWSKISGGQFFYLMEFLRVVCLPALYFVLVYSTILSVFKFKTMMRLSSFCLNMFLIILYWFMPWAFILYIAAYFFLKKYSLKVMAKHVATI